MYGLNRVSGMIVTFFNRPAWLIVFLLSLIWFFFQTNKARKRAIIVALIAAVLYVNDYVYAVFTALGENAAFYRHLWIVPYMTLVAMAIIDVARHMPGVLMKIFFLADLVFVLFFVESTNPLVYYWNIPLNPGLVSEDTIQLGDALTDMAKTAEKKLYVAAPPELVDPLRLYIGNVEVCDASSLDGEGIEGSADQAPSESGTGGVLSAACGSGIDYVVVSREGALSEGGREPFLETDSYLMYRCEGYPGYRQDVTRWGDVSWKSWYDENGEATLNEFGYCTVEYGYDGKGRITSEQFSDTNGDGIDHKLYHYARCEWTYTDGWLTEVRYYDANGDPCLKYDDMFSIIRLARNEKGQVVALSYYDENEELIDYDYRNPRATTRYEYDSQGNQVSEKYYDTKGNPSVALAGYDEIRRTFDAGHHLTEEAYYAGGVPVDRGDTGYAVIVRDYDVDGKPIQEAFYDVNGTPVNHRELGYFKRVLEYDAMGFVAQELYYDAAGNVVELPRG